ncbi:right-handed parallel beta-helix repeat-containing protein [Streptomyces sp. NPDC059011]|uniref:right-handed parallel beta-helix repeat-containing protein n=1 Tax=unclassified Streptomyces TaxID=2593676 RepID=UPI00367537D0
MPRPQEPTPHPDSGAAAQPAAVRAAGLSRRWALAVIAAAGLATATTTAAVLPATAATPAGTDRGAPATAVGVEASAHPAGVSGKGSGPVEDEDGERWAEHTGDPGRSRSADIGGPREGQDQGQGQGQGWSGEAGAGRTASGEGGEDHARGDESGTKGDGGGGGQAKNDQGRGEDEGHAPGRSGKGDGPAVPVACSPNALIAAITAANQQGGGHLSLASHCTYTLTANEDGNGLPVVIQPITIDGNGATIARAANADQFRIFEVGTGGDLKLRHLTLTRGKTAADSPEGGAIHVTPAGRLDLDHTTLHNNSTDDISTDSGGAIYNEGITTIRNSTLSKNSGDDGGAVYNDNGKLEITKTEFTRNTAGDDGGAIFSAGSTTIGKSLFKSNTAGGAAGAVHVVEGGPTDIDSSSFFYNYSQGGGGAFFTDFNGTLHVRRSTIAHNASDFGGGLYADNSSHTAIADSRFRDNTAFAGDGGGIYQAEELALRRTVVSGNQAPTNGATGGGILIEAGNVLHLTDSKITDNTSDTAPGGIDNNGTVNAFGTNTIVDNVPTNCDGSANPVPGCFG